MRNNGRIRVLGALLAGLLGTTPANAQILDVNSDMTVDSGFFDLIRVDPDPAEGTPTGVSLIYEGTASTDTMLVRNGAGVNVRGGDITVVTIFGEGGGISGPSSVSFNGGVVGTVFLRETGVVNLSGQIVVGSVFANDSSQAFISGESIGGTIYALDFSEVFFVGLAGTFSAVEIPGGWSENISGTNYSGRQFNITFTSVQSLPQSFFLRDADSGGGNGSNPGDNFSFIERAAAAPEPGTLALLALTGLTAAGFAARRRA